MKKYLLNKFNSIRNFYELVALALLMIFICSATFLASDYFGFQSNLRDAVRSQNLRAKNQFVDLFTQTQYTAQRIARQALFNNFEHGSIDKNFINNLLIGYRDSSNEAISWSTFSWSDKNYDLVVSSNIGVMETPISMKHRDYISLTKESPGEIHLGKPVFGAVSKLWSIPVGFGVTSKRGEYLGAVITGIVIEGLRNKILSSISDSNVAFAIVDAKGEILTKSEDFDSKDAEKFLHKLQKNITKNRFENDRGLYQKIDNYPYGIVTFYRFSALEKSSSVRFEIYLVLTLLILSFVTFIFFVFYQNLIAPIFDLSKLASEVLRGKKLTQKMPEFEIPEINEIAKLIKIADEKLKDDAKSAS